MTIISNFADSLSKIHQVRDKALRLEIYDRLAEDIAFLDNTESHKEDFEKKILSLLNLQTP